MILSAISIREPWATMIAQGEKTIEIRSWPTQKRERIILCASKKPAGKFSGQAFALAEIAGCRKMQPGDELLSGGIYDPDKYSWELANVRIFRPFPIHGKLGFFKIDTTLKKTV